MLNEKSQRKADCMISLLGGIKKKKKKKVELIIVESKTVITRGWGREKMRGYWSKDTKLQLQRTSKSRDLEYLDLWKYTKGMDFRCSHHKRKR